MFLVVAISPWILIPAKGHGQSGFMKEPLFKGPAPWEISADRLTYNEKEETYTAEGNVVISKDDQHLYAQRAVYSKRTAGSMSCSW